MKTFQLCLQVVVFWPWQSVLNDLCQAPLCASGHIHLEDIISPKLYVPQQAGTRSLDFVFIDGGLMHAWQNFTEGAQLQPCFPLILVSLLPWPSPLFPQTLSPWIPSILHQPSLLDTCPLASNHFFLALIFLCRAASNQEIMGSRAQQDTLPGRGLRPPAPDHCMESDPESLPWSFCLFWQWPLV